MISGETDPIHGGQLPPGWTFQKAEAEAARLLMTSLWKSCSVTSTACYEWKWTTGPSQIQGEETIHRYEYQKAWFDGDHLWRSAVRDWGRKDQLREVPIVLFQWNTMCKGEIWKCSFVAGRASMTHSGTCMKVYSGVIGCPITKPPFCGGRSSLVADQILVPLTPGRKVTEL